jgi:signal transduction histidine kinase
LKPRLAIALALLVLAPLAALSWLAWRSAAGEREVVRRRFDEMLGARLDDVAAGIARTVAGHERSLEDLAARAVAEPERLREIARGERLVRQLFVLDAEGRRIFPVAGSGNEREEAFLARTRHIWESGEGFFHPMDGPAARDGGAADGGLPSEQGWYAWFWDSGLNLIFWRRGSDGAVTGIEVDTLALLADLVGELPDGGDATTRIALLDAKGQVIHGWGGHEPSDGEAPRATRELAPPLGSLRLHLHAGPGALVGELGSGGLRGTLLGLGALVVAVLGLALWFARETGRDAREAARRVTFVNQVSHELKTPLTNIRMYAELLDDLLDDGDEKSRGYLQVISGESRRLSRLIANVLSLARGQRGKLAVRRLPAVPDRVVAEVVEQFRPSLERAGVEIAFDAGAGRPSLLDADALGQILGNLLSNVEKYAAGGGRVGIATRQAGEGLVITVADRRPGIPRRAAGRVFEPFVRLSQTVDEGASGTGIGLTIARELARLHGGDLTLEPSEIGARFAVTLTAPPLDDEGAAG